MIAMKAALASCYDHCLPDWERKSKHTSFRTTNLGLVIPGLNGFLKGGPHSGREGGSLKTVSSSPVLYEVWPAWREDGSCAALLGPQNDNKISSRLEYGYIVAM